MLSWLLIRCGDWRARRRVDPSTTTLLRPACTYICRCRTMAQTTYVPAGACLRACTHLCPCMDVDGSSGYWMTETCMAMAGRTHARTHTWTDGEDRFCLFLPCWIACMPLLGPAALPCARFSRRPLDGTRERFECMGTEFTVFFLHQSSPCL